MRYNIAKYSVETMSLHLHTENIMFMKPLKFIWDMLCSIGKARYAAELARAHKYEEAKAVMEGK